jgi:thioredoxin reductase
MTAATTQLIIVGAGPAGCSAALIAASVGMSSILVDPSPRPGGALWRIRHVTNVPGGWTDGPSYAEALQRDLSRISRTCQYLQDEAVKVEACEEEVTVALASGRSIRAEYLIIATGVRSMRATEATWVSTDLDFPPLWQITAESIREDLTVLGADRPLGTWLRSNPNFARKLTVLHPAADSYKADEIRADPRVELIPVREASVRRSELFEVEFTTLAGVPGRLSAAVVLANAGSTPAGLPGLVRGDDGYCPPDRQHPRVMTAGDLRSAGFQRIVTATGSGAEAALSVFYQSRELSR